MRILTTNYIAVSVHLCVCHTLILPLCPSVCVFVMVCDPVVDAQYIFTLVKHFMHVCMHVCCMYVLSLPRVHVFMCVCADDNICNAVIYVCMCVCADDDICNAIIYK